MDKEKLWERRRIAYIIADNLNRSQWLTYGSVLRDFLLSLH